MSLTITARALLHDRLNLNEDELDILTEKDSVIGVVAQLIVDEIFKIESADNEIARAAKRLRELSDQLLSSFAHNGAALGIGELARNARNVQQAQEARAEAVAHAVRLAAVLRGLQEA